MNEVTVNMDNLTTEEREQLFALVEKGNKKPFEVWRPTMYEDYYSVSIGGDLVKVIWQNDNNDSSFYVQGRVFKTEEEADFFSEKEKILTQYKRLAEESWAGEKINWSDMSVKKHYIELYNQRLGYTYNNLSAVQGVIFFKTKESLEAAIKTIGEENIIKYLFV